MNKAHNQPENLDIDDKDSADIPSDASLKGRTDANGVETDDVMSRRAAREALRQAEHGETFIVPSDLVDDDERAAAPGTREQE